LQAVDQVAAFVVVVAAGIGAQQVVHQLVAPGVLFQRAVELLGFIQQVTRRVEGEGFGAQAAGGLQQAPKGSY
jgi:hypothetical protein